MTPSEKPQDPDARAQGDPDSTSTMTRATDESATGTTATRSSAENGGGVDGTSGESASGATDTAQSDGSAHSDGSEHEQGDTPPWQRSTSTSAQADDGSPQPSVAEVPSPASERDGHNVSAATDRMRVGSQDAEETQAIPHPLRGTGLGEGSDGAEQDGAQGGRTTVSFAGSATATSSQGAAGPTQSAARRPSRGPRRASLQVKRVDPWSVLKLALVLSVALFFVWMIAIAVIYGVLGGMGVWDQLNGTFTELTQPENSIGEPLISAGRVFGVASIIGAINIVLITALATVGAFIYNVAADFAGGVEITLSERE